MDHVLVHYHELALKGKNRPFFIRELVKNLLAVTQGAGVKRAEQLSGRIILHLSPDASWEVLRERLSKVCGLANFSPVERVPLNIEAFKKVADKWLSESSFKSFRIQARRGNKSIPLTSVSVNETLGAYVKGKSGAKVDLDHAEEIFYIEMMPGEAFCYFEKQQGLGGLPVGVSGLLVSLLSGGLDSPVAAYRMMKRGARLIFVHFHSHPFLSRASAEKAEDLAQLLTQYQCRSELYLIPFGEIQREVVLNCPVPLRVVLYRRLMMRIAQAIAEDQGGKALITGESLGQVASQTIENMTVIEDAVHLPILRPLIGMGKEEIVQQTKEINSYEISILPDQDCCQLFVPKHPAVRSTIKEARAAEERLDIEKWVNSALKQAKKIQYTYP